MLPFTRRDLGQRRWVVKWIDKFRLVGLNQETPTVEVLLVALPEAMSQAGIHASVGASASGLLASGGSLPASSERVKSVRVEVGWVNQLRIGLVYSATGPTIQIPTEKRTLRLSKESSVQSLLIGRPKFRNSPIGPTFISQTELFNPKDHGLERSRCVVFNIDETEYIFPRTVLFSTFYGFNAKIANEICRGPWSTVASRLISFRTYESGIKTIADDKERIWYIVLQDGVSRNHEQQLAALWFDEYARRATEEIYNDALLQWDAVTSPHWFCTARIPFELSESPVEFKVEGYTLARASSSGRQRFLVTSILSYPWTFDFRVYGEVNGSNQQAEDPSRRITVDGEYRRRKHAVEGSSSANADRTANPDARTSTNVFRAQPIEIVGAPPITRQRKDSSKRFTGTGRRDREGPSPNVSTGVPGYQSEAPAKADSVAHKRDPAQQFEFFLEALEVLREEQTITQFADCAPLEYGQLISRNGRSCWALMCVDGSMPEKKPVHGWEVMTEQLEHASGGEKRTILRYSRALLVVEVHVGSHRLLILEIEPRRSDRLRMFCVANPTGRIKVAMAEVVDNIRAQCGAIPNEDLESVFGVLEGERVEAWRHSYEYNECERNGSELKAVGMCPKYLGRRIVSLVAELGHGAIAE